jgi:rhamnogalacturonan endolyase
MKLRSFLLLMTVLSLMAIVSVSAATGAKVQFFNSNLSTNNNTLYLNFNLVNTGTDPITLSSVKMRYYFTNDGTQSNNFACDWASAGNGNITGTFTAITTVTGADRYFEAGFTDGAGTLAAGASTQVVIRVWKSDWSSFSQSNDYSFNSSASAFTDWTKVTAYIGGTLYWGTPAGDESITPTPTQGTTPTPTPETTATPIPTPTPGTTATTTPGSGPPYQSENAVYGGSAVFENTNSGYNGTGYINFPSTGGYLEFQNVDGGAGGAMTLKFRNALGATASRTGILRVNGGTAVDITFDPTGSWTAWTIKEVGVTLNSGAVNTIRLESTGQDLANIDELDIAASSSTPSPTGVTPVPTPTPTATATQQPGSGRQMENLDRGLTAVKVSNGVYVGWRMLGTDSTSISFNVYRDGTKITASPITNSTNYLDTSGTNSSSYFIRSVLNGVEQTQSESAGVWSQNYLSIPLQIPAGGTTPDGVAYTYSANDCSVGDLDGDHQYEIIVKWDPSNSKDNSQSGYTGNVYLDAYKLNGTRLWRIDLGKNIRAGAHYTQFMIYDLDGDGKAEVACKTADGTKDGKGTVIGSSSADYRNSSGYILSGPEYLTIFNGQTGAAMTTVNYEPARGTVSSWGDSYGNRVDRFLACIAYLDGTRPSLIMCRGYYTRAVLVAYNWRNGSLSKAWTFDSNSSGNSGYAGQGNHNLSVGDVDSDGKDEIVYGSCTIDDNGKGLYTTGLGHGDALHLGDFDPDRAGLEVWQCHEGGSGATFRDAKTGSVIFKYDNSGDVGRACCDDMTASFRGCESWASGTSLFSCKGANAGSRPSPVNFVIWWDGDLLRELLDGTTISKYGGSTLLSASGCSSNNSTKSTPCLSGDILGDWREEVVFRTSDSSALRIYTTTTVTSNRIFTLMHDPQYRLSIAWQNVAYNQPPHVGFYLGDGMTQPALPKIYLAP